MSIADSTHPLVNLKAGWTLDYENDFEENGPRQCLTRCNRCGAIVSDRYQHDRFHDALLKLRAI